MNRSFSRRIGKTLSSLQKNLLESELPKYLFKVDNCANYQDIFLEIGFGMGEHFIHQMKLNPNALFIGVEAYLNGVANVLKLAKQENITNFMLWPDDLDLIIKDLPENCLSNIYILFPDPWLKRKQQKKRIINKERLDILAAKLKKKGTLIFASDIVNYFNASKELMVQNGFSIVNKNFTVPHFGYITTKFHHKANLVGRKVYFLEATII